MKKQVHNLVLVTLLSSLFLVNFGVEPPAAHAASFNDVDASTDWGSAILYIADRNWISGYWTTTQCGTTAPPCFKPDATATRGQLSKMIVEAKLSEGIQYYQPATATFQDVPTTDTFWKYIETMNYYTWASGYPCGGPDEPCVPPANKPYFRPGKPTTKGQLAKILARAMNNVRQYVAPLYAHFPVDVPVGSTFYSYVETVYGHYAMRGVSQTEFGVGHDVSRREIAIGLYRLTAHEFLFVHLGLYAGSNNYDGGPPNCANPNVNGGFTPPVVGSQVGWNDNYGTYTRFATVAREISWDAEARSYLSCNSGWKVAIVFHAFDHPQGNTSCQEGGYDGTFFTNLPAPVGVHSQPSCVQFSHNEARVWTSGISSINASSPEYFVHAVWSPSSGDQAAGQITVDNYQLDGNNNKIRNDFMQKFCYKRGSGNEPNSRYGIFPCP
jgi:hypothetical protein